MASFFPAYVSSHVLHIGSKHSPSCCSSSPSSSSVTSECIRRPGALCDAALSALEQVYTARNALPQTGGCAHLLGRLASETRDAALSTITSFFGAADDTVSLHLSETEPILAVLGALRIRRREEIVLGLHDDPAFTAPLRAHVLALGGAVRWITPVNAGAYAFEQITGMISSRTRLVALQMVSPLQGRAISGEDDPLVLALRYARGAGVSTALDATHAIASGYVGVPNLPADIVVCGAAGVRGHLGSAVAVRNGERVVLNAVREGDDSGVCGHTGTAAVASYAATLDSLRDGSVWERNAACANALEAALEKIPAVDVLGGLDQARAAPVVSMSSKDVCLEEVSRALWKYCPDDAAAAKLRVLKPFGEGRGKKKASRPPLICMEFSAVTHGEADITRTVEEISDQLTKTKKRGGLERLAR